MSKHVLFTLDNLKNFDLVEAINKTLTNILGFDYELPEDDSETTDELEVTEYTGTEKINPRLKSRTQK